MESTIIRLIATSDLHGKFVPWDYALDQESSAGSVAQLSTAVRQYRTPNTILLDAGDTIQDNSAEMFISDDQHPMAIAMNYVGYDACVTGNHDYNYGITTLRRFADSLNCRTLVGNVWDADGMALSDGLALFERSGIRIAVIGMVTPNIKRWDSRNLEGCRVANPVHECRRIIESISGRYDLLVGIMHMGIDNEYDMAGSGVRDLTASCPEFDIVIAAHSHKPISGQEYNGVLVVENLPQAQTMSVIDIEMQRKAGHWAVMSRSSELVEISPFEPDAALMERLEPYHLRAREDAAIPIGTFAGDSLVPAVVTDGLPTAHIMETPLIDLINRVQMHYTHADVSATALFREDANLEKGPIRKCDVALIYKFSNTLYKVHMNGRQLRTFMEWSATYYATYHHGDAAMSINPDMPSYNHYLFSGVFHKIDVSCEPGNRVKDLTWPDGRPVDDGDSLTMAVSDYCANTLLLIPGTLYEKDMPELLDIDVRGDLGGIRELIRDYISSVEDGAIDPQLDGWWSIIGND